MADWLTYSLADFLPFSRGTYLRLFALYNVRFWPAGLIGLGLGLWTLWLLHRPEAGRIRAALGTFAVCWIWIAWAFHLQSYAPINSAAPYAAVGFAAQGLLLSGMALAGGAAGLTARTGHAARIGVALVALAVLMLPLLGLLSDRSWLGLELFGSAPDPTTLATLGLMLLIRHRLRPMLLIVPLVWSLVSGLTLLAMGDALWPVLPVSASVILALVLWQRQLALGRLQVRLQSDRGTADVRSMGAAARTRRELGGGW